MWGHDITVNTDHESIVSTIKKADATGRVARWLEMMAEFHVTVTHVPGSKLTVADAISRRTDLMNNILVSGISAPKYASDIKEAYKTDEFFANIWYGISNASIKVSPKVSTMLQHYKL